MNFSKGVLWERDGWDETGLQGEREREMRQEDADRMSGWKVLGIVEFGSGQIITHQLSSAHY